MSRQCKVALLFLAAFLIPLFFALYTQHAWEDWYITYRASKNLSLGNGLQYSAGEPLHSFTSPAGTLLPALFSYILGNNSDNHVLWIFRLFGCFLMGGTALIVYRMISHFDFKQEAIFLLFGMLLFDSKIVDFSINGMETAFVVFFLSLAIFSDVFPHQRASITRGIAWSGMMWSRPDGFIYFISLCIGFLLFANGALAFKSRSEQIVSYLRSSILLALIYGPWLLWTWNTYGSFVPHTVVAKGLSNSPISLGSILTFPADSLLNPSLLDLVFTPAYSHFGGWPEVVLLASRLLAWFCSFAWVLPSCIPIVKGLSFASLLGNLYLTFCASYPFPWYIPSITLINILILSFVAHSAFSSLTEIGNSKVPRLSLKTSQILLRCCIATVVGVSLCLLLSSAFQLKVQQELVEDGNRKQIGLWLKENAESPLDTVFVECLGYVGFYSNLKMYDFPGLSSPEVVAARRQLKTNDYAVLINHLEPDWLVLRPSEEVVVDRQNPCILGKKYRLKKEFDVSDKIRQYSFLPGLGYLNVDRAFKIFKRERSAVCQ